MTAERADSASPALPDPPGSRATQNMKHTDTTKERPLAAWSALLLALPLTALASCGGSSGGGGNTQPPPVPAPEAVWDQFDWDAENWS